MCDNINYRIIDKEHQQDIHLPNESFQLFGKLIPTYDGESWSYVTEITNDGSVMCFPDEAYLFDAMETNHLFIGAYHGETCIGLAILQHATFKYMYLYDLKVSQEFRGRAVGTGLINYCKEKALEMGYRGIYTQGQDNNLGACLFYLQNGFIIGGLDTKVYNGTLQEGKKDIYFYLESV